MRARQRRLESGLLITAGFAAWIAVACSGTATRLERAAAARSPEASWAYLGEAMEEAAALVEATAEDDLERREGYRMLARTLSLGFDRFLEYGRSDVPELLRLQSPHRKFAGDNPDQLYHAAAIDGGRSYRLRGRWSDDETTTQLIEISVYGGGLRFDDETARRRLIGTLDERDLHFDDDGRFEVVLSAKPHEGDWIALEDDAEQVLVRRYFARPQPIDRLPLSIELLGEPASAAPLDRAQLARGLVGAAAFLVETVGIWGGWTANVRARLGPNWIGPLPDDGTLLTPGAMHYLEGAWELEVDEALVLRFVPPDVPYWSFVPMNVWMESLDWRIASVSINNFGAVRDPQDGSVTIVLSEKNPGFGNWIPTLGHRRGLMAFRLARLGERPLPEVSTEVVPVAALASRATQAR